MIPYIEIPALHLFGDVAIQPFGVLVVTAVAVGVWMTRKRNAEAGYDDDEIVTALYWCLGFAFFISHVVEIVFYQTHRLSTEGVVALLKVWDGLSSIGGFLGAFIGLFLYFSVLQKKSWVPQAEFIVQGLVVGWVFGRLGCTVVHDHPGEFTDFFLGVRYPEGTRHDLGFYEMLFTLLVLNPVVLAIHRLKPPPGTYIAVVCLLYAPVRFGLDFLRVKDQAGADPRYLGLTAAHYGTLVILGAGVYFAFYAWRHRGQTLDNPNPVSAQGGASGGKPKGGKQASGTGKKGKKKKAS